MPLIIIHFLWPLITGLMAKHSGRKFWIWFLVGALLPCLGLVILFFLPRKTKEKAGLKTIVSDKNHLSASA